MRFSMILTSASGDIHNLLGSHHFSEIRDLNPEPSAREAYELAHGVANVKRLALSLDRNPLEFAPFLWCAPACSNGEISPQFSRDRL